MSGITQRHTFRGNPSLYAKKLAIICLLAIVGTLLLGYFGLQEKSPGFYLFMSAVAIVVSVGRYFSMMGLKGPDALVIDTDGVTLQGHSKSKVIPWNELRSVKSVATRGGMLWQFEAAQTKIEFFLDGLTGEQKENLKKTIGSISLPGVTVSLEHYDQG